VSIIRDLLVQLGVVFDTSGLAQGENALEGFMGKVRGVGAALAGAFALDQIKDFALGMIHSADALGDQAQRLNISVEALERWRYAASFVEIQGEALDGIFGRLSRSVYAASEGTGTQAEALADLGVKTEDANGKLKSTDVLFQEIGIALAGVEDDAKRTAIAMQFFGRTDATKVLALFSEGAEGIEKLNAEFEELTGGGMAEFVEQAGLVDDELKRLGTAWEASKVSIAGIFVPALLRVVQVMTRAAVWFRELNEGTSILKTGLIALGVVGVVQLSRMLGSVNALIGRFALLAIKVVLPLLLLEDFLTFLDGGDSIIGRVIDKFFGPGASEKVRGFIRDVGKALSDLWGGSFPNLIANAQALSFDFFEQWKKDIAASGDEWSGLNVALLDVWQFTIDTILGDWDVALERLAAVWDGLALAFEIAWTEIKFFGLGVVAELSDAIDGLLNQFDKVLGIDTEGKGGTAVREVDDLHAKAKKKLLRQGEGITARLNTGREGGALAPSQARTADGGAVTINQSFPPGTPQATRDAARKGASEGMRAAGQYEGRRARAPNRAAAESFKRKGK
jgi:TP901 family phage tail tape measure protein